MSSPERRGRRRRGVRILGSIVYWLVVFAISLALVVGLVLLLESRDESEIEGEARRVTPALLARAVAGRPGRAGYAPGRRSSRAKTTMRSAAL